VTVIEGQRRLNFHAPLNGNAPTPLLPVKISLLNGNYEFQFKAMPDTGATRTVIAQDLLVANGLGKYIVKSNNIRLRVADGNLMPVTGSIKLIVKGVFHNIAHVVNALVTPVMHQEMMLSWHDLVGMRVISPNFPFDVIPAAVSVTRAKHILTSADDREVALVKEDFKDVFGNELKEGYIGLHGAPMHIELRTDVDVKPCHVKTARPIPLHLRAGAQKVLDELLASKRIVKLSSKV